MIGSAAGKVRLADFVSEGVELSPVGSATGVSGASVPSVSERISTSPAVGDASEGAGVSSGTFDSTAEGGGLSCFGSARGPPGTGVFSFSGAGVSVTNASASVPAGASSYSASIGASSPSKTSAKEA